MVQHVLLMLVAAPLLALAAPITLLLRRRSPETRRRWILPVLHSRVVRFMAPPGRGLADVHGVMWASHFSPLFDAALEDPLVHDLEHALFLPAALLFWWPAVALDPRAVADGPPGAIVLPVPPDAPEHVPGGGDPRATGRPLPALRDARPAVGADAARRPAGSPAGIMWLAGDLIFLDAIMAVMSGWMRAEERRRGAGRPPRRRGAAPRSAMRERRLAERLADERERARRG